MNVIDFTKAQFKGQIAFSILLTFNNSVYQTKYFFIKKV